ncbi:uncharacterized protein RJT21DRAFT_20471 [Scheffersomyces amazonensis]|uniref:uncharacterized protein n=1 Tax=Scheffersomyces amazonensis TaxID=1078765 RepID=UPI00315C980C
MADFDTSRFFDFENADDFLDSISGSLSSSSNNNGGVFMENSISSNSNQNSSANNYDEPLNRFYSNTSDNTSIEWSDSNTNNIINTNNSNDLNIDSVNSDDYPINHDLINPNINITLPTGTDSVFDDIVSSGTKNNNNGGRVDSMSTSTYSQDDGITPPHVNTSISSVHTSPEPAKVKLEAGTSEEEYDYSESDDQKSLGNTGKPPKKSSKKASRVTKPKIKDKSSHNMIEKKYRTNINSKILTLRDAVPSLRIAAGKGDISIADLEGLTPASKLNKASVLTKATEYIKHLESKNEILRSQNIQLQRLIQDVNLHPQPQQQPQLAHQLAPPQQQPQQAQGFGFYPPNDQSFYATPIQQSYSGNGGSFVFSGNQQFSPQAPQIPPQQQQPNKFLMGGMAAVMGTSLFAGTGTNDFKGLSALPFAHLLPYALTHPSPLVIQFWTLFKVLLFVGSVASLILPIINKPASDKSSKTAVTTEQNLIISWFLVTLGFQLPIELSSSQRDAIVSRLVNGNGDWIQLFKDYTLLSISQINFENCFLNLITGRILTFKYPISEKLLNHNLSIKGSLILNLDYKGKSKSIKKLNQLVSQFDGLSLLGSETLMLRLINLINGKHINYEINDGQNHVKYVEFLQDNGEDYYAIILNWRMLEIIHELNLNYLQDLNDEDHSKDILKDLNKIDEIISKEDGRIYHYFKLFKTILNSNDGPYLLKDINDQVERYLVNFKTILEGQELTDHEIFEDEEEEQDVEHEEDEEEEEVEVDEETVAPIIKFKPTLKAQKSLITSLNLVNEEQFIILVSSLIVYYYKNNEISHAIKLLNYLKLSSSTHKLTCLSFSSIINLLKELIPGKIEDNEVLDNLIKVSREWLNETKFMDFELRSDLSKFIIDKAVILNGIEANDTDDE